jgi:hypothetical protein
MSAAHEAGRLAGLNRLFAAIQRASDAGDVTPCTVARRSHLWLSEESEDQRAAALGCLACPALAACQAYVTAFPERAGVWAGRVGRREVTL